MKPQEKILVVDDDKRIYKILCAFYTDYEFIPVYTVEDAKSILETRCDIDLVLVDYRIHDKTGIDIIKEVKRLKLGIGIILMTAYGSKDLVVSLLEEKVDAYIEKPFQEELLRAKINSILEQTHRRRYFTSLEDIIHEVCSFFEQKDSVFYTLKELSFRYSFSEKYFSRMFKQIKGVSFSEFRMELLLKRAIYLLEMTDFNMADIADQLGYENTNAFYKMFKKKIGKTPSEYRISFLQMLILHPFDLMAYLTFN